MSKDTKAVANVTEEEEEMVDPHQKLRDKCAATEKCNAFYEKLTTCNDRVNSRKKTAETCMEELIDYMHCVDHCAAKKVFNFLK